MLPIITISREVGSNGHAIGEMLAKNLDIPLLDKAFIAKIAEDTGFHEKTIENKGEYFSELEMYMNASFYNGLYLGDDQTDLYHRQREIILEQAKKGPCVIVGRCADAILTEEGIPCLKVFIHADMKYRIQVYKSRYPNLENDVEKLMKKKDKGRRAYYRFYTDQEWGDVNMYDLCLDSSRLGLEACTALIAQAAKAMEDPGAELQYLFV